jgi:hypothetical protein
LGSAAFGIYAALSSIHVEQPHNIDSALPKNQTHCCKINPERSTDPNISSCSTMKIFNQVNACFHSIEWEVYLMRLAFHLMPSYYFNIMAYLLLNYYSVIQSRVLIMKITKEEANFIRQTFDTDDKYERTEIPLTMSTEQISKWIKAYPTASELQLIAKIDEQALYFPANIHDHNDDEIRFSCGIPSIIETTYHQRQWRIENLNTVFASIKDQSIKFKVLSLSLSGLVLRTYPYNAQDLYLVLNKKNLLILLNECDVELSVKVHRIINQYDIALEIQNIAHGSETLKAFIFEQYQNKNRK